MLESHSYQKIIFTNVVMSVVDDETQVVYHRVCALRTYFLIFVGIEVFVDKCVVYVGVLYIKYFTNLERTHKYKWGHLV